MTDGKQHIDPLPADISEYLETDRRSVVVPKEIHERILSRIAGSLGVALAATADAAISSGAAEISAEGTDLATDAFSDVLTDATADAVASGGSTILATILKAKVVIAFAAGMGVGTGSYAVYDKVTEKPAPMLACGAHLPTFQAAGLSGIKHTDPPGNIPACPGKPG